MKQSLLNIFNLPAKTIKMPKKQYDDTELEYYGLTEEDLEKIKSEKTYTLEEVENSLKMQWMIEDMFWVKITDTDVLLDLYNRFSKNVQNYIWKESKQTFSTVR